MQCFTKVYSTKFCQTRVQDVDFFEAVNCIRVYNVSGYKKITGMPFATSSESYWQKCWKDPVLGLTRTLADNPAHCILEHPYVVFKKCCNYFYLGCFCSTRHGGYLKVLSRSNQKRKQTKCGGMSIASSKDRTQTRSKLWENCSMILRCHEPLNRVLKRFCPVFFEK
jgi:hypothetical protein